MEAKHFTDLEAQQARHVVASVNYIHSVKQKKLVCSRKEMDEWQQGEYNKEKIFPPASPGTHQNI